ncbi:MAG: OmpA family protein [Akkermansia sp.]
MKNKSTIITFCASFIIVGSLVAVFTWKNLSPNQEDQPQNVDANKPTQSVAPEKRNLPQPSVEEPQTPTPTKIDLSKEQLSPHALMGVLTNILKDSNNKLIDDMETGMAIDPRSAELLRKTLAEGNMDIADNDAMREIGSWDNGKKVRFEVTFKNGQKGIVDFECNAEGKWVVNSIKLPTGKIVNGGDSGNMQELADSMGVADLFVRSALSSDIKTLKSLIDPETVNNATIVGICILFEDNNYRLRPHLPIKGMFGGDKNAGFLAYLNDTQGKSAGNIGMSMKKVDDKGWIITEVSLNSLLDDYAKRYSEGDSVYVPLVKNPKGGDSLALFFGFNEDTLTPRSIKQLGIVAKVIKLDEGKKLQISGHTDDIGSNQYNIGLSERRAAAVKKTLVDNGVDPEKIDTKGYGKNQPRRTYSEKTDQALMEEIRRDNRRAEMYLDF